MEFIDFWLWSCKSYFKFFTCQHCTGSLSWTAAYYGWESSLVGFLMPPAAKPLCVPCSGAAHPDALRGLRANPDPFPSCSPMHGCAWRCGVPAQARPCCIAPRKRGNEELCTADVRQWLGGPSSAGGKPPVPAHLHSRFPHTRIMVLSSPLQRKAWKPEPDARFHLHLQTAWKQ